MGRIAHNAARVSHRVHSPHKASLSPSQKKAGLTINTMRQIRKVVESSNNEQEAIAHMIAARKKELEHQATSLGWHVPSPLIDHAAKRWVLLALERTHK